VLPPRCCAPLSLEALDFLLEALILELEAMGAAIVYESGIQLVANLA
jgi:hypothetical protein